MDPGDLEYNQRGLLGPGQRARLQSLSDLYDAGGIACALGTAADAARAFRAKLRQSIHDARVVVFTGEVEIDLPAFRSGMAEGRIHDLPGNFESAYFAVLEAGARIKLAHWLYLLPGRYVFYVVAAADFVVGASRLPPFDHEQTYFGALCAAQGIDVETLAGARRGRMTEVQQMALRSAPNIPYELALFCLILSLLGGLVAVAILAGFRPFRDVSTVAITVGAALELFFIVFGIYMYVEGRRFHVATRLDADEGRIAAVDGPFLKDFRVVHRSSSGHRQFKVDGHTFDVTHRAELYATLVPGFVHRAYLAPRSRQLLAIEYLREGKLS